ncbi:hypothetical protein ACXVUM_13335 [Williamsia sp. SKLECPSW1]
MSGSADLPPRTALADAVDSLDAMVSLLAEHGPSTSNARLRSVADLGRECLEKPLDPAAAAIEMQRRLLSMGRSLTDIVVHGDDAAERRRLNTEFESLKSSLIGSLRQATERTRRLGRIRPVAGGAVQASRSVREPNLFEMTMISDDRAAPRPVVGSAGDSPVDEAVEFWVRVGCDPGRTVEILRTRESESAVVSISGDRRVRQVVGVVDGLAVRSLLRTSAALRTSWSAQAADGHELLRLEERTGDSLWRRLVRPVLRSFRNSIPDLFGAIVLSPLLLLGRVKPLCRLVVSTPDGERMGSIAVASGLQDAVDHIVVRVDSPEIDRLDVLIAAFAAASAMR